jgi:hypothetical protein
MRTLLLVTIGLFAGGGVAACAASAPVDAGITDGAVPLCMGDDWTSFDWIVDSVAGRTPCVHAYGTGWISSARPSVEPLAYIIGPDGTPEVHPPLEILPQPPLCLAAAYVYNTALRTGATGGMAADQPYDSRPAFVVTADFVDGGGANCYTRDIVGREGRHATGGTWTVLQGGSWGDVVDIEARDVTFEPFLGHTVAIPYVRWRVRLTDAPLAYP